MLFIQRFPISVILSKKYIQYTRVLGAMPIKCETAWVRTIWRYLKSTLAIFQLTRIFQNHASDLSAPKSCVLTLFQQGRIPDSPTHKASLLLKRFSCSDVCDERSFGYSVFLSYPLYRKPFRIFTSSFSER